MAKCIYCGEELQSGAAFCPNCGGKVETQENSNHAFTDEVNNKINDFTNTADTTSEYSPEDINANKIMAILSYIGILVLIPIFCAKDSKFAKFHANQGIVLAIAEIIVSVLVKIFSAIPVLGLFIALAGGLIGLATFVFTIMGIINAANGKAKELPIIGGIRILK